MTKHDREEGAPETSIASDAVRAMLSRHDVPKHRQASLVQELLGLSRAAAYNRTYGAAAWTLEELQLLARKFGETLPEMLGGGAAALQEGSANSRMAALEARVEALEQALSNAATVLTDSIRKQDRP